MTSDGALAGGVANRGRVVRVGGTVHRPRGPYSEAVHTLLRHLEASGFDGAPRVVGRYRDTEVLGYIDGAAANPPEPEWALTDDALHSVAVLLRDYHRHARGFGVPDGLAWQRPLPTEWRGDIVTHNDPHPANVVFRDGRAVALIDFDLAAPGSVAFELAVAACFWAPLREERDIDDSRAGRGLERFRLLLDAYGAPPELRHDVVRATRAANAWISDIIEDGYQAGHPAFTEEWATWGERYARAARWLHVHHADLLTAAS
jgi:hypothetical protein